MSKPPKSSPHSDIDGVHEDERRNVDTAVDAGQDSIDLQNAAEETTARPPYSNDQENLDDRAE